MTIIKSFDVSIPVRRLPPLTAEALTRELTALGLQVVLPDQLRIDEELRYTPVRVLLKDGREIRTGLALTWSAPGNEDEEEDDDLGEDEELDEEGDDPDESDDDEVDEVDSEDELNEDEEEDEDEEGDDEEEGEDEDEEEGEDEDADLDEEDAGADAEDDAEETPTIDGEIGAVQLWAKNAPVPTDENEVLVALYFAAAIARLGDGEVVVHDWDGGPRSAQEILERIDAEFDASTPAWSEYPYDLFLAAEDGDAAAVATALAAGAAVDAMNNQGVTPLMLALANDRAAASWELLRSGANPRAVNYFGKAAVEYADSCSDDWLRGEIERRASFPHHELFELIAEGDSNGVLAALSAGAPVDAATPEGFTLLMAAVRAEDENLVDALLRRGAEVNRLTSSGVSALDVVHAVDNVGLKKVLLAHGAVSGHPSR